MFVKIFTPPFGYTRRQSDRSNDWCKFTYLTDERSQRTMIEKRPQMEKTIRTQRECTIAPMKSRRQKTANRAGKNFI